MPRIPNKHLKIFASDADNNGVFGSAADNTKILSNNVELLQSKLAWGEGWGAAVIGTKKFPTLEEFQSCNYINTHFISYILQEGIAEWNEHKTYYQKSIAKKTGTYEIYGSLTDDNTGNPLSDGDNWQFLIDLSLQQKIPFGVSTGTDPSFSVTTDPVFTVLENGTPFIVRWSANNSGAASLNPNSINDLPIRANGAALSGGELKAGGIYLFFQDNTNNCVHLANPSLVQASTTRIGGVEIATPAEAIDQVSQSLALTPYNLSQMFTASGRQSLAQDGYQIFPGGLIEQWGRLVNVNLNENIQLDVTFPMEFPNSCLNIQATVALTSTVNGSVTPTIIKGTITKTGFKISGDNSFGSDTVVGDIFWNAKGV